MRNSIADRIADFLKGFPPFNNLSFEDLSRIASEVRVVSLEKNRTLFKANDPLHDSFYVVASGLINLTVIADADETLLNKCVPGDVFGLRPFFAKNNYMMTAKAREESIVYAIPIAVFRPYVARNHEVLNFLLESFAATSNNISDSGKLISDSISLPESKPELQFFQSLNYSKTPIKVHSSVLSNEVALMMTENMTDCALVVQNDFPIGLITDADMRSKIATGRFPVTIAADRIMSSPVITVGESISLAEAQLLMLKNNVSHLCVTVDGSDHSEIIGLISQHDLVVSQASNPGVLIKEIKKSHTAKELRDVREKLSEIIRTSMNKNIPLPHVHGIAGEINMALIKRAVELSILDLGSPPARFAWMAIGSQGRREQLLYTDQDSFLVFEDVAPEKYRDVRDYFLKLGKRVVTILEKVGYAPCPNGHIASNPQWCHSLSDWIRQFENWMTAPGEKANQISGIFFDFELAFGEIALEEALLNAVFKNNRKNSFYDYLGNDALRKPSALSFFKKFQTEEEGPQSGRFDIVLRGLMPLIDAARLISIAQGLRGVTYTHTRFKQLARNEPKHAEAYQNCAEAFLLLSRYRTLEGLKDDNSGRYVNLDELSKTEREKIKDAVETREEIEEIIKSKFRLTQFS